MEIVCYIASDNSGMSEIDLIDYIEFKRKEIEGFIFSDWFAENDFLDKDIFWKLKNYYDNQ